jgi:nuclear pore complex protein Nup155
VYFTTTPFTPLAFRPPPTGDLNLSSETFYSSGTVLGIQHNTSTPTRTTSLTAIVPHPGLQAAGRENFENFLPPSLQEWSLTDTIPSQVWTIAEVPSTNPINSGVGLRRNDGLALSPLPRQASESARQFLVLATSGLFFVAQPRPIDVLQADVELEKDAAINTVRNTYMHCCRLMGD